MEVKELQAKIIAYVREWEKFQKHVPSEEFIVLHLVEEVGELAHEYVSEKIRPTQFSEDKLNNAIADILFQVIALAEKRELDVEKLLLQTMEEDTPRMQG